MGETTFSPLYRRKNYKRGEKIKMKLHELKPAEGSRKVRNRVGRYFIR